MLVKAVIDHTFKALHLTGTVSQYQKKNPNKNNVVTQRKGILGTEKRTKYRFHWYC